MVDRMRRVSSLNGSSAGFIRRSALGMRMGALVMMMMIVSLSSLARAEFTVPPLTGPVIDSGEILQRQTESALDNALRALRTQGGTQITVLTVPSLEGLAIEQASIRVVDEWKLGDEKSDSGVLLMIAVKDRRVRIEVGQGLEGSLTDADSSRIIHESMLPLFKSGDYDSGILVGVYQIARKTNPDIDLTPYLEGQVRRKGPRSQISFSSFLVILFLFLLLGFFGGGRGRGLHRRAHYGHGGWGGGGFGGSGGGGGWSGGGGGFSGGGASGSW